MYPKFENPLFRAQRKKNNFFGGGGAEGFIKAVKNVDMSLLPGDLARIMADFLGRQGIH